MKANKTKERILDTSIKLFNEKKASNVSTVQISAAMKISPGNLYYYYANKEEVIRHIWGKRIVRDIDELIDRYADTETADDLLDLFKEGMEHCLKYRFFYTEMPTLFVNDGSLTALYVEAKNKIRTVCTGIYGTLVKKGKMIKAGESEISYIIDNGLTLFAGIASYCDVAAVEGIENDEFVKVVWQRMAAYMKPQFTDVMREEISEALKVRGVSGI